MYVYTQPLNYEANRQVILQIGVLNEGQFSKAANGQTPTMCTTTVTVKIRDSDEGPECQPPVKIIQSKDGLPAGQELLGYKAKDPETSSSEGIRWCASLKAPALLRGHELISYLEMVSVSPLCSFDVYF